jgi:hypothetical protein
MIGLGAGKKILPKTLPEYVDFLKQRPGVFNYDTYLENPRAAVGPVDPRAPSAEPDFVRKTTQPAKNLTHPSTLGRVREAMEAGSTEGEQVLDLCNIDGHCGCSLCRAGNFIDVQRDDGPVEALMTQGGSMSAPIRWRMPSVGRSARN